MFKKTDDSVQFNMFSDPKDLMNEKSRKKFSDPGAWHNLFRNHILFGIDEDQFRPLYTQVTGAPNSSIKLLIGMMIIKESLQCSDKQLFEQCEFNLLVRSALGLINIDDPLLPSQPIICYENGSTLLIDKRAMTYLQKFFMGLLLSRLKNLKLTAAVFVWTVN